MWSPGLVHLFEPPKRCGGIFSEPLAVSRGLSLDVRLLIRTHGARPPGPTRTATAETGLLRNPFGPA
jgi:hypothetical protein